MFTLILPVAGRSSRFPNMRPKWLLTMPDGKLMIEQSIENIDLSRFDRVVIVCLKEHLEKYTAEEQVVESFERATKVRPDLVILDQPTSSQSETIYQAIKQGNIEGSFFIKDCDNTFECQPEPINSVCTIDLNDIELVDAKNKSYVEVDSLDVISNIVEKEVISNFFCCGGYSFQSAKEFCDTFENISSDKEVYISHVIYKMLMSGAEFVRRTASKYTDWGTLREYRHYCRKYLTVFCDVDGVLLKNGSKFAQDGWKTSGIEANLLKIAQLQKDGGLYLILTSSRPESEIEYTTNELARFGVRVDRCLFGLPHTRRYLINDYSATNPYPSAVAVNLERDSETLSHLLDD
ncbi:NTP transferase domain-containing protein [Vibrio paucivorans]|uniref:NTP transferase domain-containing protein n=1 Tax=Vibrio paucivorans TaxID=2829489 RepID=A0A9X3HR10_9VIBR|nr:NTP transferase domain-containing protein [Vibrio paucivorans]MCW8333628.1 NTP transferase domain-containing protein [Vibrio paucivorans]